MFGVLIKVFLCFNLLIALDEVEASPVTIIEQIHSLATYIFLGMEGIG